MEGHRTVVIVTITGTDEAAAAGIAQNAVGQRDVLGLRLHIKQRVVTLTLAAGRFQGEMVRPHVVDIALHTDGITTVGDGRPGFFHVTHVQVLQDDVGGIAQVNTQLVEERTTADTDQRNIADILDLDFVVGGIAAGTRHFAGIAVIDGAFHVNDDGSIAGRAIAQGGVDFGTGSGIHHIAAGAAGGTSV